MSTEITAEVRAEWRELAADLKRWAENGMDVGASRAISALLDALESAEDKASEVMRSCCACHDVARVRAREAEARAERAEAALARVEALADECASSDCIHLNTLWGRLRAALDTPATEGGE